MPVTLESRSGANLGTPEAARVVRALLAPENAARRWTQREMVDHFADLTPAIRIAQLRLGDTAQRVACSDGVGLAPLDRARHNRRAP